MARKIVSLLTLVEIKHDAASRGFVEGYRVALADLDERANNLNRQIVLATDSFVPATEATSHRAFIARTIVYEEADPVLRLPLNV